MLIENVFKRIFVNSNRNLSLFKRISANSNHKAQKRFRENKMTSFFGQVSRYLFVWLDHQFTTGRLLALKMENAVKCLSQ